MLSDAGHGPQSLGFPSLQLLAALPSSPRSASARGTRLATLPAFCDCRLVFPVGRFGDGSGGDPAPECCCLGRSLSQRDLSLTPVKPVRTSLRAWNSEPTGGRARWQNTSPGASARPTHCSSQTREGPRSRSRGWLPLSGRVEPREAWTGTAAPYSQTRGRGRAGDRAGWPGTHAPAARGPESSTSRNAQELSSPGSLCQLPALRQSRF